MLYSVIVTRSKKTLISVSAPLYICLHVSAHRIDPVKIDTMSQPQDICTGGEGLKLVTDIWLQTLYSAAYSSHQSGDTELMQSWC